MPSLTQPNLAGGEISPSLYGRADLTLYQTSLRTCKNFITQAFGGARNRQGTMFIGRGASDNSAVIPRLVRFSFSAEQNYVLELTGSSASFPNGSMRILSRGRFMTYSANEVARLAALPTPITVTEGSIVTVPIPWTQSVLRKLKFSQSGDVLTVTHPSYAPRQIKRYANDQWSVDYMPFENGPWMDQNFDEGKTVSVTGVSNDITIACKTSPIFTAATAGRLFKIWQEGFGEAWEANKDIQAGQVCRSDGKYYKALNSGKTGTLRPVHDEGKWFDGIATIEWEFMHPGFGICEILAPSADGLSTTARVLSRLPDAVIGDLATPIQIIGCEKGSSAGGYPLTLITTNAAHGLTNPCEVDVQIRYRVNGFTGWSDYSKKKVKGTVLTTTTIELDISWGIFSGILELGDAPITEVEVTDSYLSVPQANSSYKWAFGAWGGDQGWPTCSAYFQQRHCFAATPKQPQTVWMSKSGDYSNFGETNPIADDDALTYTIASAQIDGIQSMLALDKLVLFTLGGNWVTGSGADDVITPGNIAAKLQNYYGSAGLPPLVVGNTVLYYGRGGSVRDMAYDFASDSYVGNDLTVRAGHLLETYPLVEWDFQQSPFPIIWGVREDGALLGATYMKEQQVIGWHRHDLTGTVESVCVVNECGTDHVYLSTSRTINGSAQRHIEVMYEWVDDLYECRFMDANGQYDGRNTAATHTITVTGGTLWTADPAENLTLTHKISTVASALFASGDVGDQIVLQAADGTLYRLNITAYTSSSVVTAQLASGTLPADLRSTATSNWAFARDTFSGLTHLAGMSVNVHADGDAVYDDMTAKTKYVVNGSGVLTLDTPAFVVTCGLPITAEMETLDLVVPGQSGPAMENRKLIKAVHLLLEKSRSLYVGQNSSNLMYQQLRTEEDVNTVVQRHTGMLSVNTPASWNRNGRLVVRHTEPYPLSVLAIIPDIALGEV